jgi:hypothetical protein
MRKRQAIDASHPSLSVSRQCQLLGLARSSLYASPAPESAENLFLMRLLDQQYLDTPFYGVLRMTAWLNRQGHAVNVKRVRRLLRLMGLEAIYPKPRRTLTSIEDTAAKMSRGGLKAASVGRVNQGQKQPANLPSIYLTGWLRIKRLFHYRPFCQICRYVPFRRLLWWRDL